MTVNLSTPKQIWLIALLFIWAGLLFGGFAFGKLSDDESRRMPTWTRTASSLTLVAAGWSWWLITQESDFHRLALLVAVGMTFGFTGDLFMAELIPLGDRVLGGIGAFGLGHVAYIAGLVRFGDAFGYDDPASRWGALAGWLAIGTIAWYVVVLPGRTRESHYFAHGRLALCPVAGRDDGLCNGISTANVTVYTLRHRRGPLSAQ